MRTTHSYAIVPVSYSTHCEIAGKLRDANYQHAFGADGEIDMHGLAIDAEPVAAPEWHELPANGYIQRLFTLHVGCMCLQVHGYKYMPDTWFLSCAFMEFFDLETNDLSVAKARALDIVASKLRGSLDLVEAARQ